MQIRWEKSECLAWRFLISLIQAKTFQNFRKQRIHLGRNMNTWLRSLLLMLGLVFLLAACSPTARTTTTIPATGESDELFINMMVPHHQGAVEMARIALERSDRAEVREMAQAIIASQEAEVQQMREWKQQWYGSTDFPPMSEMPSMREMPGHGSPGHPMDMQAEVDALREAPDPFDLAFIDAMIPHHQSAIEAAELVLAATERPELRQMAQAIIAEQQREIEQMLSWRSEWFPGAPAPSSPAH
jgi:uncharacterized protein (DUF305 family)